MKSYILPLLLTLLTFASCSDNREARELYATINRAIDENPDSAVILLDSIEKHLDLEDPDIANYYGLLKVKTADKAYIPHKSDSLILSVLPYFEKHTEHLAEAYYYAGRVNSDLGDAPVAMEYFEKSLDALPDESHELEVLRQKSVIYAQMGDLAYMQNDKEKAIDYQKKALSYDLAQNDSVKALYDLTNIASSFASSNVDSAFWYLNLAKSVSHRIKDERGGSEVLYQEALLYVMKEDYDNALKCYQRIDRTWQETNDNIQRVGGIIYYKLGDYKSAEACWNNVLMGNNPFAMHDAYAGLTNIAIKHNDTDKAIRYLNLCLSNSDSVNAQIKLDAFERIQSLYNYQHYTNKMKELEVSTVKKSRSITMLLCSVVLLLLSVALLVRNIRIRQLYSDLQKMRYKRLQERLESMQAKTVLGTMGNSNQNLNSSDIVRRLTQKSQENLIMSAMDWHDVEELINSEYSTFIQSLKDLRFLNETDMRISMLLKLGFSPTSIAKLIGKEKSTITVARRRMYKKTFGKDGDPKDWDLFINSL